MFSSPGAPAPFGKGLRGLQFSDKSPPTMGPERLPGHLPFVSLRPRGAAGPAGLLPHERVGETSGRMQEWEGDREWGVDTETRRQTQGETQRLEEAERNSPSSSAGSELQGERLWLSHTGHGRLRRGTDVLREAIPQPDPLLQERVLNCNLGQALLPGAPNAVKAGFFPVI